MQFKDKSAQVLYDELKRTGVLSNAEKICLLIAFAERHENK